MSAGEGFANRGLPEVLGFHTFMTVSQTGDVTSVHQVPDEPFIHSCDPDARCICGPQVVVNTMHGVAMPMVRHAALDVAYTPAYEDLEELTDGELDELFDDDD